MRMLLRFAGFFGMLIVVFLTSCKTGRTINDGKAGGSPKHLEGIYRSLLTADEYTWYSGKARFRVTTPDIRMSATINLRMVRDSVIWATVDKFGFEVARVLITPDSVFVVDRLNQEYTSEAIKVFLDEYGMQISFADLQSAFAGGMINVSPKARQCIQEDNCNVFLVDNPYGISGKHWVTAGQPPRLLKSTFVDRDGRTLELENSKWEAVGKNRMLPFGRFLAFADDDGITEIELTFSSITLDEPATLPFSIPPHYANAR
jgi:hypothetical protein